jgi:tetratricopeptide (TPR) repeat protein
MSSAEELKAQGNAKFAAGDWAAAEGLYTKALALDADNAALYSNRSICRLHAGQSQAALADAQRCVQLRPDWEKGHYRQGAALESLGDLAAVSLLWLSTHAPRVFPGRAARRSPCTPGRLPHSHPTTQALPAYQQALELNPMSEELLSKVKALKKQLPKDKQPKQAPGAGAIPKVQVC